MPDGGFDRARDKAASAGEGVRLTAMVVGLICAWLLSLEALGVGPI